MATRPWHPPPANRTRHHPAPLLKGHAMRPLRGQPGQPIHHPLHPQTKRHPMEAQKENPLTVPKNHQTGYALLPCLSACLSPVGHPPPCARSIAPHAPARHCVLRQAPPPRASAPVPQTLHEQACARPLLKRHGRKTEKGVPALQAVQHRPPRQAGSHPPPGTAPAAPQPPIHLAPPPYPARPRQKTRHSPHT